MGKGAWKCDGGKGCGQRFAALQGEPERGRLEDSVRPRHNPGPDVSSKACAGCGHDESRHLKAHGTSPGMGSLCSECPCDYFVPAPTQTAEQKAASVVRQIDDAYEAFCPDDGSKFREAEYDKFRVTVITNAILDAQAPAATQDARRYWRLRVLVQGEITGVRKDYEGWKYDVMGRTVSEHELFSTREEAEPVREARLKEVTEQKERFERDNFRSATKKQIWSAHDIVDCNVHLDSGSVIWLNGVTVDEAMAAVEAFDSETTQHDNAKGDK